MGKPTAKREESGDRTVAVNRRGRFNYEIEDTFEAGLVLTGTEVKSLRNHQAQIAESYATLEKGPHDRLEMWVQGMYIAPYEQGNAFNVEPRRKRKLLLNRTEIDRLSGKVAQKGYALVPLKLYFARGRAKLQIGLGKGLKRHDKRRAIEKREMQRRLEREA